jgi:uncharacterized membrane protein (DUF106 family)
MIIEEVIKSNPIFCLIIISIIVTFVSTLAHKHLTDQEHLHNQKKRQKEIQKELRGCKDPKKLNELNIEMMKITGVMFKSSMRPLLITIVPFLLLFIWLKGVYTPLMGNGWIWYYIGFSIVSSIILRKIFKVA